MQCIIQHYPLHWLRCRLNFSLATTIRHRVPKRIPTPPSSDKPTGNQFEAIDRPIYIACSEGRDGPKLLHYCNHLICTYPCFPFLYPCFFYSISPHLCVYRHNIIHTKYLLRGWYIHSLFSTHWSGFYWPLMLCSEMKTLINCILLMHPCMYRIPLSSYVDKTGTSRSYRHCTFAGKSGYSLRGKPA